MAVKHDLIFFENRSTPKVIAKGQPFDAPESYGKQTKRRAATEDEEKKIANGEWVRVDENGTKGGQDGYKKTKMPGREHLVHELVDDLMHYGVKGMRWDQSKRTGTTVTDQNPANRAPAAPVPRGAPAGDRIVARTPPPRGAPAATVKDAATHNFTKPTPQNKKRTALGANFMKNLFTRGAIPRPSTMPPVELKPRGAPAAMGRGLSRGG